MTMNHPVRQVFTAEDLLMMLDDGFRYELIRGELIKRAPPGGEHGSVAMNMGSALHQFVKTNNLGIVYANDILDGGEVVPGWTIPVREIFA